MTTGKEGTDRLLPIASVRFLLDSVHRSFSKSRNSGTYSSLSSTTSDVKDRFSASPRASRRTCAAKSL